MFDTDGNERVDKNEFLVVRYDTIPLVLMLWGLLYGTYYPSGSINFNNSKKIMEIYQLLFVLKNIKFIKFRN